VSGIVYAREQSLSVADYSAVLASTYMGDKRPLKNPERVRRILKGSNLIVTARDADGTIAGVARGISDGEWVCYLADLCVRDGWQGKGIGTGLLDKCYAILGPGVGLVLLAYPDAVPFYQRIGMGEMPGFYHDRLVST
jgi:GNAT superfamily N-acetyltransferase